MTDKLRQAAEMSLKAMLNFENVVVGRTSFHKLTGDDVFSAEINALHQALAEPPNSTTDVVEPEKPCGWVGLTDEEIEHIWGITPPDYVDRFALPRMIEAKLKEKNT